jgi:hypothetical protein
LSCQTGDEKVDKERRKELCARYRRVPYALSGFKIFVLFEN